MTELKLIWLLKHHPKDLHFGPLQSFYWTNGSKQYSSRTYMFSEKGCFVKLPQSMPKIQLCSLLWETDKVSLTSFGLILRFHLVSRKNNTQVPRFYLHGETPKVWNQLVFANSLACFVNVYRDTTRSVHFNSGKMHILNFTADGFLPRPIVLPLLFSHLQTSA